MDTTKSKSLIAYMDMVSNEMPNSKIIFILSEGSEFIVVASKTTYKTDAVGMFEVARVNARTELIREYQDKTRTKIIKGKKK